MPRGQNPNSLENLKKGRRFGASDDSARKSAQKSAESRAALASIAEEMRSILTDEKRRVLAQQLIDSMGKSPEWFKLGLRMLGELPPEQMEVYRPAEEVAQDIRDTLEKRMQELAEGGIQ